MVDAGDRISVSIGEGDAKMVNEFDDYFGDVDDPYNRAQRIKEAMELYMNLHKHASDLEHVTPPDDMGLRGFKAYLRQAVFDRDRHEAKLEQVE